MPLDGPTPPDVLDQINLLLRLHRMTLQVQRRALLAQKERLTKNQTESQSTPAKTPAPAPAPPAEPAPLTRKQNAQMNRWLNQAELQPAILPPLATNRQPKNFPALAGFYEKP